MSHELKGATSAGTHQVEELLIRVAEGLYS